MIYRFEVDLQVNLFYFFAYFIQFGVLHNLAVCMLFLVAANIVWAGVRLLRETGSELRDASIPIAERHIITDILATYDKQGIQFHALRTRVAGVRRFVSFHVLVSEEWSVQRGHALYEDIELKIVDSLPRTHIFTNLEPLEDPVLWDDQNLDWITSNK